MTRFKNLLLIILSATLYAVSFMVHFLWWTIFLFTIPLHLLRTNFLNGFFWGLWGFGIHTSGLLYATMRMQNGPWPLRAIPPLLVILYFAIQAGIWFVILEKIKTIKMYKKNYFLCTVSINVIFFWYMSYASLWPICGWQGYPFFNPLLPLVKSPLCLFLIGQLGFIGTMYVAFLIPNLIFLSKERIILTVFCIIILIFPTAPAEHSALAEWVRAIAPFQTQFSSSKNSTVSLEYLNHFIRNHPDKKIFITPESSFYGDNIFDENNLAILDAPGKECILGSFSSNQTARHNTLYWIKNGAIQDLHHKQHAVALTETVPLWARLPWLEQLHDKSTFISPADKKQDVWSVNGQPIEPYICSEFFCQLFPLHPLQTSSSVLLCCNDAWFTGWADYVKVLMINDARLKAVLWHTDIVYIGYQDALYINRSGYYCPLF